MFLEILLLILSNKKKFINNITNNLNKCKKCKNIIVLIWIALQLKIMLSLAQIIIIKIFKIKSIWKKLNNNKKNYNNYKNILRNINKILLNVTIYNLY